MSELAEKVLSEALKLTTQERAKVAAELIASVDGDPDPDAERAWAVEIDRRIRQLDSDGPSGDEFRAVHERIAARLRRK